ncbi:hypothetical protein [Agromyces italicus]|uniref:hypothetical protein n=1 Tax=Agromyces italicus TaxID=279572 RepID=UPI0003B61D8B|nr:hypothetical protein [Agromyces italicus]
MTLARDIPNVLADFRTTSRDLYNWRKVSDYAFEAENAVELLQDMADDYGAAGVIPVVQKAIASTFRVLMRADDSGGLIQVVIDKLLALHAKLCAEAPPAPAKLVAWIQKQQFGELGEYFELDVVDYADALGEKGVARFESELFVRRAALTLPFDGRPDAEFSHDDEWLARHAVLANMQRLAVLHRDEEAIVRTHGGDLPKAHRRADAAKALAEAGFTARAAAVAHEGMTLPGGPHQQQECGELWRTLAVEADPAQAADVATEVFERWPTAANASALERADEASWPSRREAAIERMRARPWELIAYLMDASDVRRAWSEALRSLDEATGRLDPDRWDELVDRYLPIDPAAALPVMAQLIDDRLVEANTRVYPGAVRRMKKLREAAVRAGMPEFGDELLAHLRAKYARRPSLIKRMDAARV